MARLSATPRLVRSIEDRMTIPCSSMSWTVSSLHEYQSTIRSRFSFATESRFTPRSRSSARTASGDWDAVTTNPLPPDLSPSAKNVSANWSFSWPGGPWRTTLEPTGRPPPTIASNPGTPVGSRGMVSFLQRTRQAGAECEVRVRTDRISECRLVVALRGIRSQSLRADVSDVPVDCVVVLPVTVKAGLGPIDHLFEDGLPEFLMVRGEAMLHLDLDRWRADVPDGFGAGVEVRDVEVDHLAQGTGLVVEIDLEPQMRGQLALRDSDGDVRSAGGGTE